MLQPKPPPGPPLPPKKANPPLCPNMNKYYLIAPLALLLAFLFTPSVGYFSAQKKIAEKVAAADRLKAETKAAEDKRKEEIARKANADAQKRQEERDAEDRAKLEKKEKDYADAMNKLKDETNGYVTETDKLVKENAELEIQLGNLEIQRMVEMVGTKVGASTVAQIPVPVAPPASK
jgi:hypothetical protein